MGISNDLSRFDDCIFCIHLQRQYSAAKELAAFYETYNLNSDSKIDNPALQQYHEALKVCNLSHFKNMMESIFCMIVEGSIE